MLTELKKLADEFPAQPLMRGRKMRDLLEHSPREFCTAAVEVLSGHDSERAKRYLVALLWTNNLLIPCLTDPSTPCQKAEAIAALARRVDPQLPAKLVGFVLERTETEDPECLERILELLRSMPDAASFRPLLTPLLRHPNARIRSKVALLAGEGNRNRTWFERRMLEDDPRVRANAIESVGQGIAEDLRPLFHVAASDSNNRVVGNALIALYRLGDPQAIASLHELSCRPDPAFRSTAVWAMGETGDSRFLPVLARILTDPNETIKAATFRAMRKLRGRETADANPLEVRIVSTPVLNETGAKITFGVTDHQHQLVRGIPATSVRIAANGEAVYHYAIAEQEIRRRIRAGFIIPDAITYNPTLQGNCMESLQACFHERHSGDSWIVDHFTESAPAGSPSRPETLFGVQIGLTETRNFRVISSISDIRSAVESRDSKSAADFGSAFRRMCQELRPSRISSHLFLLHPLMLSKSSSDEWSRMAQDSHVSVHAICKAPDPLMRQLSESTGGFYLTSSDLAGTLPAMYRALFHRYHATVTCQEAVHHVQIAVRLEDSFGETATVESPVLQ